LNAVVGQSEAIVMGEALSSRTVKTDQGIYTFTDFRVDQTLDGAAGSVVTVAVPGGSYETGTGVRVGEVIAGAPQLLPGQDAVLFLENDQATGEMCVVGFSQGMMTVSANAGDVSLSGLGQSDMSLGSLKSAIRAARSGSSSEK